MRIVHPERFQHQTERAHPVTLLGANRETFQVTVLGQDLFRVQHFPAGQPRLTRTWSIAGTDGDVPREGRRRDDLSPFSLPNFTQRSADGTLRLATDLVRVEIDLGACSLTWSNRFNQIFAADLPGRAYAYDQQGEAVFHYLQRRSDEYYYGFGERAGPLDKQGLRMRMVNLDALGYSAKDSDPLYKHIPFYITYVPELNVAYGLFYDNLSNAVFDLGQEHHNYYSPYRYYQAEAGDLDYYLIYGPTIAEVVQKFSKLIGRPALPPRWSLGYLGSSMLYTDAEDAQAALKRFVEECQQHQIPCDMFHLSSGYSSGEDGKRYVFTWNERKIPHPREMIATFHQAGMKVMANIKPCLLKSHPRYPEVQALGGFIKNPENGEPRLDYFWGGHGAHLDFTNPQAYQWWQANVRDQLLELGVDATWNDNNEYAIEDDEATCDGFGEPLKLKHLRPVQAYLMVRASREAQLAHQPDQRPFLLSRSAAPGTQRYAQTWSGDNRTSWETLRYNIPMGLGLSLSGFPNTGHDVGGFTGPGPSPELLVRWVQNGIFHPRFTIHSWNTDGTVNTPWMHPSVLPVIRQAIQLRYRLMPYLYTRFFEAHRSGHPIIRPLVYQFPRDENCYQASFDFMCGPDLLIASVLAPGVRERSVYLPRGVDWVDVRSGKCYHGGETIQALAPLDYIPILAVAGAVIPQGKDMRYVGEQRDDVRVLFLYPHESEGQYTSYLVEDDGLSLGYQRGEYTELFFTLVSTPQALLLEISYGHRGYQLPYENLQVILPNLETRPLQIVCPQDLNAKRVKL